MGNAIPERWSQPYKNLDGSLAQPVVPPSVNTFTREEYVQRLQSLSGAMDTNVTAVFQNHIPECRAYILAYGEIPASDLITMAAQACLLRACDIAWQAEALDISDEDALQTIEQAEAAAQSDNTPDNYSMLSFQVQAAVKIVLDSLALQVPGGRMSNLIALLRGDVSDMSLNGFSENTFSVDAMLKPASTVSNADGDDDDDTESPVTVGLASTGSSDTGFSDNSNTIGGLLNPTIPLAGETSSTATVSSSPSSSSGVMGFLSGLVSDATAASTAVKSISTTATSTGSTLSNLVNSLGSGTLAKYVQNNQSTIWMVGIAVVLVIVIAIVYAGRKK
jgi:hypothetical protein